MIRYDHHSSQSDPPTPPYIIRFIIELRKRGKVEYGVDSGDGLNANRRRYVILIEYLRGAITHRVTMHEIKINHSHDLLRVNLER